MQKTAFAAVCCAAILLLPASAAARCKDGAICIDELRQGANLELRARNLLDYPISFTVQVRGKFAPGRDRGTITRSLAPNESRQALLLDDVHDTSRLRYTIDWTVGSLDVEHDNSALYRWPYAAGKSYYVLQGYGSRFSHTGLEEFAVDFDMPTGTPVHAARGGVVARLEESHSTGCWDDGCGKYANYLVILHADGTTGEYYHLDHNGVLVDVGDTVTMGQKIALSGNTGHTTMPHLHFAVYRAIAFGRTQSIRVRYAGTNGIIDRPRRGGRYENPKGNDND